MDTKRKFYFVKASEKIINNNPEIKNSKKKRLRIRN